MGVALIITVKYVKIFISAGRLLNNVFFIFYIHNLTSS